MSTPGKPPGVTFLFYAVLAVLTLLNAGLYLVQEAPEHPVYQNTDIFEIPHALGGWQGRNVEVSEASLRILAPAQLTSRAYYPSQQNRFSLKQGKDVVWLNVIQSKAVGTLHNFYDSLVASGSDPRILGTHTIPTSKGALKATLIRYKNAQNYPYYLLLWYQWQGGSAPNRWQWYLEILKLRAQQKTTPWQLIEASTPIVHTGQTPSKSVDLDRLDNFVRAFYEQASF